MSSTEREVALDTLNEYASGVDHDDWRGLRFRRRLDAALALISDLPDLREHELLLLEAVHIQRRADLERAEWERLGGAK